MSSLCTHTDYQAIEHLKILLVPIKQEDIPESPETLAQYKEHFLVKDTNFE